jgi:hypothetical protein
MSWKKLPKPLTQNKSIKKPALSASSNGTGGRFTHWLDFVLRPAALDVDWLHKGAGVDVAIGEKEHAGFLMLSRGRDFTVSSVGGVNAKSEAVVRLRIPAVAGQTTKKFKPCDLSYEIAGGGISSLIFAACSIP